ncbi:MAG TPA: DUF192 domain-containing protein [Dehalococcoidia bacterium]|jgi:hypothetical protein
MIVRNPERESLLGEAIEVADTSVRKVKGLLGRECLEDGQGLLFKGCSSLHTFFMRFPIDIVFLDRSGKVLKLSRNVKPFKLVAAPLRAYYAVELPSGAISRSETKVGDALTFEDDDEEDASPFRLAA